MGARARALAMGALGFALLGALGACSRPEPDATPEGAVRMWLDKMEATAEDPRAAKDAFQLLGPAARANLEHRAERASLVMGRRVEPHEMLAEGRFGLKFRPKSMTAHVTGERAVDGQTPGAHAVDGQTPGAHVTVDVVGAEPTERARVSCTREAGGWRVEPEIPELPPAAPR